MVLAIIILYTDLRTILISNTYIYIYSIYIYMYCIAICCAIDINDDTSCTYLFSVQCNPNISQPLRSFSCNQETSHLAMYSKVLARATLSQLPGSVLVSSSKYVKK